MLFSLSNRAILFLEYFYLKNRPKKHVPSSSLPWKEWIPSLLFTCFLDYFLHRHSSKNFLYRRNLKILVSLKQHGFNIKHYMHKTYLHKIFILVYIQIKNFCAQKKTKQNKNKQTSYFEKFIEELDFVEISTQAKHLRVCILHDDWLNDNSRYYC